MSVCIRKAEPGAGVAALAGSIERVLGVGTSQNLESYVCLVVGTS